MRCTDYLAVHSGVDDQPRVFGGASGAQSTTLPAMDAVLGIKHSITGASFMKGQLARMPPKHREYLSTIMDMAKASLLCLYFAL